MKVRMSKEMAIPTAEEWDSIYALKTHDYKYKTQKGDTKDIKFPWFPNGGPFVNLKISSVKLILSPNNPEHTRIEMSFVFDEYLILNAPNRTYINTFAGNNIVSLVDINLNDKFQSMAVDAPEPPKSKPKTKKVIQKYSESEEEEEPVKGKPSKYSRSPDTKSNYIDYEKSDEEERKIPKVSSKKSPAYHEERIDRRKRELY